MGDILDVTKRLARTLDDAGFEYAVGGGIALAFWGAPRATVDVDVGVNVNELRVPELIATLLASGFEVDSNKALSDAARGDFGARMDGVRIDVFLPVFSLAQEALARRVMVDLDGTGLWVVDAEALVLLKTLYGRTKDFADLERIFAMQHGKLDLTYVEAMAGSLFLPKDPRLEKLHDLIRHSKTHEP